MRPDLDHWLDRPDVRVRHSRKTDVEPGVLWAAAQSVRTSDTRRLGKLLRLRIPGLRSDMSYDELFHEPPFTVLCEDENAVLAGIVGRIWTLRRDYPTLAEPDDFRRWSARGTVRVLFANWVEPIGAGVTAIISETRISASDPLARFGLAAVRPLIVASHQLIGSEGLEEAVSRSHRAPPRLARSDGPATELR